MATYCTVVRIYFDRAKSCDATKVTRRRPEKLPYRIIIQQATPAAGGRAVLAVKTRLLHCYAARAMLY